MTDLLSVTSPALSESEASAARNALRAADYCRTIESPAALAAALVDCGLDVDAAADLAAQHGNDPQLVRVQYALFARAAAAPAPATPAHGPAAAKMLRDAGLRVIPCGADKLPRVAGFGADSPAFSVKTDDFQPDELPAILCGPTSIMDDDGFPKHLVCLDLDGGLMLQQVEAALGVSLPATLTSHDAKHVYFFVPRSPARDRLRQWNDLFDVRKDAPPGTKAAALDLKWRGGYAVERGDWQQGGFDVTKIATLPAEALDALLATPCALRSGPMDADTDGAPRDAERAVLLATLRNADPQVIEAACEYIENEAPESVSGQGGNDALFEVARVLVLSFALEAESARDLLDIYNERKCEPSWDASTIERVMARAREVGTNQIGGRLVEIAGAFERVTASNGVAPAAHPTAPDGGSLAPATPRKRIEIVSAADLSRPLPPVPWLAKALGIAPGRPTVIVGKAGSGKTLAVQDFAIAVASGQPVFGDSRFAVRQGSVLHLDLDQGRYATARRYQQLARGRGLDLAALPIDCAFFGFKLTEGATISVEAVHALTEAAEGRALVIIDSLRGLAPGLDENSSEFGEVLQTLAYIADAVELRTGQPAPVFLVLHHSGKGESSAAGRGTSAIMDRAGAVWVVAREEGSDAATWTHEKASELALGKQGPFTTALVKGAPDPEGSPADVRIVTMAPAPNTDAVTRDERVAVARVLAQRAYVDNGCSAHGIRGLGTGIAEKRLRVVLGVMVANREVEHRGSGPKSTYKLDAGGQVLLSAN